MDAYPLVILFCNYRTTHEDCASTRTAPVGTADRLRGGGGRGQAARKSLGEGENLGGGGGVAKDRGGKRGWHTPRSNATTHELQAKRIHSIAWR